MTGIFFAYEGKDNLLAKGDFLSDVVKKAIRKSRKYTGHVVCPAGFHFFEAGQYKHTVVEGYPEDENAKIEVSPYLVRRYG